MSPGDHNFLFGSLESKRPLTARKVHIRRLYDVLQLSIHRQDYARARRAWSILARCNEISWKSLWTIGLLLVGENSTATDVSEERLDYLRSLMLQHQDEREAILTELIHCLVSLAKYREALNELELYLPSYPFQDNPILHVYAGLLSFYLAQEASEGEPHFSPLLRDAQSHFEHAKELDPDNPIAQVFIKKISAIDQDRQVHDADSDQETMKIDEDTTPKSKRART